MASNESQYRTLLAYLPYSELSDRIEDAISEWLSNPTNVNQFAKPDTADWMVTAHVSIAGVDKFGNKVRMQSNGQLMFRGTLKRGTNNAE
jgi:hypothetical protein